MAGSVHSGCAATRDADMRVPALMELSENNDYIHIIQGRTDRCVV